MNKVEPIKLRVDLVYDGETKNFWRYRGMMDIHHKSMFVPTIYIDRARFPKPPANLVVTIEEKK